MRGSHPPEFAAVREALALCVPKDAPGGAAVCVYHRGERVVDLATGTRNPAGDPFETHTLALSMSTSKGVTATLMHVLLDRGLLEIDAPVARYWPEFGQAGKASITIRQLLSHQAGLHVVAPLVRHARDMLEWDRMIHALERAEPVHRPGEDFGYHAFTFGWLCGELAQRATGKPFQELLRTYLAEPLGLEGLYIGVPESELPRVATFVGPRRLPMLPTGLASATKRTLHVATRLLGLNTEIDEATHALFPPGLAELDLNDPSFLRAVLPSVNGCYDARSLAKLYAVLAHGGSLDGVRLLSKEAIVRASTDQNAAIDRVIPFPLRVKMGYHRPISLGLPIRIAGKRIDLGVASPEAFGHFGFGGSGAWADPERDLAVGLVTNTFFGRLPFDLRTVAIATAAAHAADRRRRA